MHLPGRIAPARVFSRFRNAVWDGVVKKERTLTAPNACLETPESVSLSVAPELQKTVEHGLELQCGAA
jgi:hypothetical protein